MAQVTTTLPAGVSAFNNVTLSGSGENTILTILAGDGGQLKLVELQGQVSAATRFRVYALQAGVKSQLAEFNVGAAGTYNQKLASVAGVVDEVPVTNLPYAAGLSLGILGQGGLVVTAAGTGSATVQATALCDRRQIGPFDFA